MSDDPGSPDASLPPSAGQAPRSRRQRRRRPRIQAWRYDEGYGEDRYALGEEDQGPRRRRRPWWRRWRSGPQGELLELLTLLPRRHPLASVLLAAVGLWLLWPTVRGFGSVASRRAGAPEVITVFVEDPQRTVAALELWRERPGSLLVLQGRPDSQAINRRQLSQRGLLSDTPGGGVVMLTRGCDTLGQLTTLAGYLERLPRRPGRLTVVTGPAHLERSLAIARIVAGSAGWEVEGLSAITGDNRPEAAWRLWRDQARAQLWRLTGWDGSGDGTACRARRLTERG
ncbi:MAG: ElyC/SanA/YdcF family protein [Synechococcaceae cyanobacterium]|nr:ElyC/SanA/YdcF family protein [Synechococcaceae cyanobacterium]